MNLFLSIQITDTPEEVKFYNPILAQLKNEKHDLTIYDLDNHSESFIIGYANKLLSEATQTIVFIETKPESSFPKLMSLLVYLLDNPEEKQIIIKGNNLRLENMLSVFPQFKVLETTHGIQQIQQILTKFL